VGIVGTVFAIVNSFTGFDGEKSTIMAAVTLNLSEAIIPTAVGLLIALFASWSHRYLCSELETLDIEMKDAGLALANSLSLLRQRIRE
jgi:biopolymer transport protein ExbB/TolQ